MKKPMSDTISEEIWKWLKGIIYYFLFKARFASFVHNFIDESYIFLSYSKPVTNILKQVSPTIVSSTTGAIVIFIAHPIGIAESYAAVVASIVTTKIASEIIDKIYQQTIYLMTSSSRPTLLF